MAADFRVFYRLTPKKTERLSGPEYLALAYRTGAYQGAIAAQVAAENEEEPAQDEGEVAPTRDAIEASPLAGLIEWSGGGGTGV